MPAQILQGRSEGANDTGPFRVIDPAICSQAGGQDGEKSSTWRRAAGVGLSPSGVRELAQGTVLAPIRESVDGSRSVPDTKEIPSSSSFSSSSSSSSSDQACSSEELTGETHDTCPSATGEMCFSFFTNGSLNETKRETRITSGLVSDWFNATMGESCYQSLVLPSLHPEDEPGTEACVLSSAPSGYRPAINVMDMMEHHPSPQRNAAGVPGPQRCTTLSITYGHDALIPIPQERFQPSAPPPPSALRPPDRAPAAADTFEKIQLSSSDDDEECGGDEGPGHSPVLTGPAELWESSRRLLPRALPGAQSPSQRGGEPGARSPGQRGGGEPGAQSPGQRGGEPGAQSPGQRGGEPGAQSPSQRGGGEPGAQSPGQRGGEPGAQSPGQRGGEPQPQRGETGGRCLDSINRPGEIPRRASTASPACRPPVTQPAPAPAGSPGS
ncbi:unnamed protein product [Gadus morhua 'NCC']